MNDKTMKERAERVARVRDTLAKIQSNHLSWIVQAAADDFVEKIQKAEERIVRNEALKGVPRVGRYRSDTNTREQEIANDREVLVAYRQIVVFLHAMDDFLSFESALEFATGIKLSGLDELIRSTKKGG